MAREDLHFRLRIPEELKAKVEQSASDNHRSMTAEIVARLEDSFASAQNVRSDDGTKNEKLFFQKLDELNQSMRQTSHAFKFILVEILENNGRVGKNTISMARKILEGATPHEGDKSNSPTE